MDTEELRASLAILIAALRGSNEDCHRRAADSAAVSTMQAKALVQHESASAAKYREQAWQASSNLRVIRLDRLEAESQLLELEMRAEGHGICLEETAGTNAESAKHFRAQQEALREVTLSLDAAALVAHMSFSSCSARGETERDPDRSLSKSEARRFYYQLMAEGTPDGAAVAGSARLEVAASAESSADEVFTTSRRAEMERAAFRSLGEDMIAWDATLAHVECGGRDGGAWRCSFSTRRRGTSARVVAEELPDGGLRFTSDLHLGRGCEEASRGWLAGRMEAGDVVREALWAAIDARTEPQTSES